LALKAGYRHIDTAALYGNEADVGRAVRDSVSELGLTRESIFVTTKLWNSDHGFERAKKACRESYDRLGLGPIDLYLIHWPVARKREESWRALIDLKREGLIRSIGVSNYTIRHLQELLDTSGVVPSVNQVEFSPFLFQKELLEFCVSKGIRLEAYSPLTRGERLEDERLLKLAKKYGRTPAQLLIRWCLEHDVIVLPKSNTPARILENASVFDFTIDSRDLDEMDSWNEDYRASWDPTDAP
jgi:diketogulonate reductase-like aldo/keto reductase